MSQDIMSDNLNRIMNAKRAGKTEIELTTKNKILLAVLKILEKKGDIKIEGDKIIFEKFSVIKAIKPRFEVSAKEIQKYVERYLPARDYGFLIISTSRGIMTHEDAMEKNIGGSLIAYAY